MKTYFKIIVCLFSIYYTISAQNKNCNQGEKLDLLIQRLYLFGAEDKSYPTSNKELVNFCSSTTEYQNWIKTYSDQCMRGLSKQFLGLLLYSVNKNLNAICRSTKRGKEFIKLGSCGNSAKKETVKCWNGVIKAMDAVSYQKNDKLKIPLLCCHMFAYKSCNVKAYDNYPKQCTSKAIDGYEKLIDSFALETIKFFCSDYTEDSDKCDKIIGETGESRLKVLPKSPVGPMVKVFDSIPE